MIAQKLLRRIRLKFKDESFDAIKISIEKFFFGGNFTGIELKIDPEMTFLDHQSFFEH